MEDVLETDRRTFDVDEVLVCLIVNDETARQQTKETRTPLPTRPGPVPANRGLMTSNMCAPDPIGYRQPVHALFMLCAPLEGWRPVEVTDRRTRQDFAAILRDWSGIERMFISPARPLFSSWIISTPISSPRSPTLSRRPGQSREARRTADRFAIHYTPKHGRWLNIAEMEINVRSRQCLARRIPDRETLTREVRVWQDQRNADTKPVEWRLTTDDARIKLKSLYPSIQ